MKSVLNKMTPAPTGKVTDDIFAIKDDYVNAFLVGSSDSGYIMIDCGNSPENILKGFNELNIGLEKISAIFLTHSDADHVAAVSWFPQIPVYLSKDEEQLINGKTGRFFILSNKVPDRLYNFLQDGEIIYYPGLIIKCIHTPGHTPGTTSYLINGKYLFTGDVLKLVNGKVEEFHHFINMDTEADINSIKKLSQLKGVEYILSAHYGVSSDFDKAFN
jgi:glyoxylase-like metal-dependent hydrolase (beta-lactamase superfamily II)